ncbi:hypothetical protein G7Y89_g14960 [Cudoniella acicularis]|uniref:Tetratricopeptide repeat protein n=1 Tax=Cudoniella acicularis TaxID=354080 RepID=A0A8H4VQ23_9HELO|nr:hypothetical protein G7Y89_g14960 [Cudoniella acicularis]
MRFERTGNPNNLAEALRIGQQAADTIPPEHPNLAILLNAQSNLLLCRFEMKGSIEDLDQAIDKIEEAINIIPERNSNSAVYLRNNKADLDKAIRLLGQAVKTSGTGSMLIPSLQNLGHKP